MNYYILSDWPVFWLTTFSPNFCKMNIRKYYHSKHVNIQNKKCSNHKKLSFTNKNFPVEVIMVVESVNYDWAVRGYHVYKSVGESKERQVLSCSHEWNNICDMFAIKTCLTDENGKEQIVGHLSLELSQFTNYLLDRETVVTAKLTSTHYRRSVLAQRGLEIPCRVKAEMIATEKNKHILAHYLDLLNKN